MAGPRGSRKHRRVREAPAPRYSPEPSEGLAGVLYDSDVIIEILRGRAGVVEAARRLEESGVPTYCSAVSLAEIYAGIRPGEEALTQAFFDARGEIVLDGEIGRTAGSYLARFSASHGVELGDALIAAAAATAGVRLWTRNRKHYPMPGPSFFEP
ncbi:MAG TPA: PIN domain-containing protein [Longimicrobiales bacterium]|nr:PIN domain-containing protein [Longimicrobiales bacterium]